MLASWCAGFPFVSGCLAIPKRLKVRSLHTLLYSLYKNRKGRAMEKDIHIGLMIRQELKYQRRSVAWLAEQVGCDASNAYKILKKKSIDTQQLMRISQILNKDFFSVYTTKLQTVKAGATEKPLTDPPCGTTPETSPNALTLTPEQII